MFDRAFALIAVARLFCSSEAETIDMWHSSARHGSSHGSRGEEREGVVEHTAICIQDIF